MRTELAVTIRWCGSSMWVTCHGQLDGATCGRVEQAFGIALEERPRRLIFDAMGVSGVAGPGAGALLQLVQVCRRRGIRLDLRLSPPARRALDGVGAPAVVTVDRPPASDAAPPEDMIALTHLSGDRRGTPAAVVTGGSDYFLG